ncbi:MAG: HAMP domain-containing histidine kinase, partial [bacterium]|nr:HAMP domain-containing histidine kinase [bacterium]
GGPPRPGGARPGARSPLVVFALQLARIPPVTIDRGDAIVTIAPSGPPLLRFLTIDAAFALAAIVAIAGFGVRRASLQVRGERAALLATLDERRAAAERYQRFLAETGHELRTPLTIVSGYVDILHSSQALAGVDGRIIEGLRAETTRMRTLVEKMLTLARLNSPVSVPRLLDLADAAGEIVATAQRRFPERSIAFECTRSASIVIDGDDLTEALGNLIENAVKYAPASPIRVHAGVRGALARIAVSDDGPGIPTDERDAIFERFYRARDRNGAEGLGLGLAIVKRVADRWSGAVELESQPGHTVFTLQFPLADEESDADSR